MEKIVKSFFDSKLGEFLKVEKENVVFNPVTGLCKLGKAEIKAEAFDQLHFPLALRGGFIDELSISFPVNMFGGGAAKVVINNVFFVFGPHTTDWSWEHVYACKTKLVDVVNKIMELRKSKKKDRGSHDSILLDVKKKFIDSMTKNFLGMLEVKISNIHFRYEDWTTQQSPFAAGWKLRSMVVTSNAHREDSRTSGDWRNTRTRYADPLFCQSITARRISTYWDIGKNKDSFISSRPVADQEAFQKFVRLNIRETFSLCVVEKVLQLFPLGDARRKHFEGPGFRERLDFHQYVMFPMGFDAHITVNKKSEATRLERAPLHDGDVRFNPIEVAIDSEQMRSINQLRTFVADFERKDMLLQSRPKESIARFLQRIHPEIIDESGIAQCKAQLASHSRCGTEQVGDNTGTQSGKQVLIRSWWRHAFNSVLIVCGIPRSFLGREEVRHKSHVRHQYLSLCIAEMDARAQEKMLLKSGHASSEAGRVAAITDQVRSLQMEISFRDILSWRTLARHRIAERDFHKDDDEDEDHHRAAQEEREAEKIERTTPTTVQCKMRMESFQSYFLVVADQNWAKVLAGPMLERARNTGGDAANLARKRLLRQLIFKQRFTDIHIDAVQKGRKTHWVRRWSEISIGSVSCTNCRVAKGKSRQILSVNTFDTFDGHTMAVYLAINMVSVVNPDFIKDKEVQMSVIDPSRGISAHNGIKDDEGRLDEKLCFLTEAMSKNESARQQTFAFIRVGQVLALDYTPFRNIMMYFVRRGRSSTMTDLVRRPSPSALEDDLLVKLQRRVQMLVGKSNTVGILEGECAGLRLRQVELFNKKHLYCKEMALAPFRGRAMRKGLPQHLHVQIFQADPLQELMDPGSLLPWKVGVLLLPKADFSTGFDLDVEKDPPKLVKRRPVPTEQEERHVDDMISLLEAGSFFLKWGRNGKSQKRFVQFDGNMDAILWKKTKEEKHINGVIPLSKLQDVRTGIQTPVLHKVKSTKLKTDWVCSIISTDRTLDLQADSLKQREQWVAGLKMAYRRHIQQKELKTVPEVFAMSLRDVEKRTRSYPVHMRSDHSTLKSTYRRLQAVTALAKALRAAGHKGSDDSEDEDLADQSNNLK